MVHSRLQFPGNALQCIVVVAERFQRLHRLSSLDLRFRAFRNDSIHRCGENRADERFQFAQGMRRERQGRMKRQGAADKLAEVQVAVGYGGPQQKPEGFRRCGLFGGQR